MLYRPLTLVLKVFNNSLPKNVTMNWMWIISDPFCVFQIHSVSSTFKEEINISFHVWLFYVAGGRRSSFFALYTTSVINVFPLMYIISAFCFVWFDVFFCSLSDIFQQPVLFIVPLCWVLPLTCRITIGTLHKLQTSTVPTAKSVNRSDLKVLLLLICWTYSSVQAWAMLSLEAACLNCAHSKL